MSGLFGFVWFVTLIAFVVYWWKKRKARIAGGDGYMNYPPYQQVSKTKRIIGVVCIISFFLGMITSTPTTSPEEKARITAEKQAQEEKVENEKRVAEEKKKQDEAEKQAAAELQKKYDDQAKYEEWIAWQKSEEEKNRPVETTAYEMLTIFDGNRDAAKSRFANKNIIISRCQVEFIGDGVMLCKYPAGEFEYINSSIRIENAKKIPNYLNIRKDDIIDVKGKVKGVNRKVGTDGLGRDVYGYIIEVE